MSKEKNKSDDWMEEWNTYLGTGHFDQIDEPEDGYSFGDPVCGRDGIFYKVKGITGGGKKLILDAGKTGEKVVDKDFVRFNGDVMNEIFSLGLVKIPPEKLEKMNAPQKYDGKNSELN